MPIGTKGGPISLDWFAPPSPQPAIGPAIPVSIVMPAGTMTNAENRGIAGRASTLRICCADMPRNSAGRTSQLPTAFEPVGGSKMRVKYRFWVVTMRVTSVRASNGKVAGVMFGSRLMR